MSQKGKIRGEQIKDDSITEADIADDAIKHFVHGQVDVSSNNKPVNWVNASNVSSAIGIKTWLTTPFDCRIDKIILTIKGNNFNTATDGTVSFQIFVNQPNFDNVSAEMSAGADDFQQKISNMAGGTVDCNQKIFVVPNLAIQEGDIVQVKVKKTIGGSEDEREGSVTVVFT